MPIEIRRKDVKTLVMQGRAQLVEVLPASEYKREHLPEAVNIPLDTMTAETTRVLRKDVAVIVYCADFQCDLSARAAWRLETMGFQEVYRYTPGKADWLAAGFETNNKKNTKQKRSMKLINKLAVGLVALLVVPEARRTGLASRLRVDFFFASRGDAAALRALLRAPARFAADRFAMVPQLPRL